MPAKLEQRLRGTGTAFVGGAPLGVAVVDMESLTSATGALVRGRILPRGWDLREPGLEVVDLVLDQRTYRLSPTGSRLFSRWHNVIGYEQPAS